MQKILVVEDDIDIQDILKNHLTDAGYEVVIADDGVDEIAKFDDTISLVLLDIMLPKIDGYGVCEVIRQKVASSDYYAYCALGRRKPTKGVQTAD